MPHAHAHHFESADRQGHAARLGMWAFVSSELMLFAGLIALYGAYRVEHPHELREGIAGNDVVIGTVNTFVLVTSSFTVALAVHAVRHARRRLAAMLLGLTLGLGGVFLLLKGREYAHHLAEPGQGTHALFRALYFLTTGLHGLHVLAGMVLLGWLGVGCLRGRYGPGRNEHVPVELGGLYWHLVDLVWLFLWPMFYLAGRTGS